MITRGQRGNLSKLERAAGVDGTFLVKSSIGGCALRFCRPLSVGTKTSSLNYDMPDNKLHGSLADCEGNSYNADVVKYLGAFCKETTQPLVHEAMKVMHPLIVREALKVAAAIKHEGLKFTAYLYNVLFRTFLHASRFNRAVEVLEEMQKIGVRVSAKSFYTLMSLYLKAGMEAEVEETLDLMNSFGYIRKRNIYGPLLSEYVVRGDEEGIERLLQKCYEREDFSAVLKAFAKSAKAEQALKLLNKMEALSIDMSKNRKAFGMALKCLCDANMIDDAVNQVKTLQEKGFLPSVKFFNILISALVRESRLDKALEIVSDMKDIGLQPNIGTHHLLISGYLKLGQMDEAFSHLEEMKLDGCSPTPETLKLFEETHKTPVN